MAAASSAVASALKVTSTAGPNDEEDDLAAASLLASLVRLVEDVASVGLAGLAAAAGCGAALVWGEAEAITDVVLMRNSLLQHVKVLKSLF